VECNPKLGAACSAGSARNALIFPGVFLLLLLVGTTRAQCPADPQHIFLIHQSFARHDWSEVIRLASATACRDADVNFEYGLALAHLQRWQAARAALMKGRRQSPVRAGERFDVELAGVAFEQRRNPEAAAWLRRALALDPKDEYATNFAGTVYFLMGNLEAALKYWNRIGKPYVSVVNFDPELRVRRRLLDGAFAFSPAAVLGRPDYLATKARLESLGIFPVYNIDLSARKDIGAGSSFDVNFHAVERDGAGSSRVQALVSALGGLPYETVYPSDFNIGRDAANLDSLLRWDSQKYRLWASYSAPLRDFAKFRCTVATDERDENWTIRRFFTGPAPPLGSLNLRRETLSASLTDIASGRLRWTLGAEFSHRDYRHVVDGTALTPALTTPGYALKQLASVSYQLIDVAERRLTLTAGASSQAARLWSQPSRSFGNLQGSIVTHWFPQVASDNYEAQQQLRAGRTLGRAPFDEMFMLGVERDNDLWLRGHIGTRDRQKGSSPLGYNYFLANHDFYRRIYSNGLFGIEAGPLLDLGWMGAPTSGLSTRQWLFDTGIEAKLSVLGIPVILTYGRDLRAGNNAFFGTLAKP
jgi:tetratricopeptide (TPR) repeat protein